MPETLGDQTKKLVRATGMLFGEYLAELSQHTNSAYDLAAAAAILTAAHLAREKEDEIS